MHAEGSQPRDTPSPFVGDKSAASGTTGVNDLQSSVDVDNVTVQDDSTAQFLFDDFQEGGTLPDMDLNLMWPDSEDLFQSILSADIAASWQLPPGTLPLPSTTIAPFGGPIPALANNNNDRMASLRGADSTDNHHAVHGVSEMVSQYSSSITAAVDSTSITSVFLDQCLHMFFDRFIPIFPIMHRPTFVYRDCSHPLLLNAIAIGSLYLGPNESVAKGEILWRLAHTAVATSWQTLITHRGPFDACSGVQLVLSALLSVIYGALSKNTVIRGASQALHASAFFWARQCGIFDCKPYDLAQLPPLSAPEDQKLHQWRLWVAREIQQRALLSHYLLDGLIAHMQGNSTSVRHTSNTLKLPTSENAFQDTSVDQWLNRMHAVQQDQKSFRDVYTQLFVTRDSSWPVLHGWSSFTLRVLLEGVQSIIADSDPNDGAIINPPDRSEISYALSWLYERVANCADVSEVERLEVLLRWHAVCLEAVAKTPQLCNYICKRWNVHQDLWPNRNLREHDWDLSKLVGEPEGRKALLHAVAIQQLVEQLPSGRAHAVHMPSSLFASATIYGVFSFAGQANVRLPSVIEWKDVVLVSADLQVGQSETAQFVHYNRWPSGQILTPSKNVLYELNSVQKLFRALGTQWGVSSDMEKVIGQWIALCQS